MPVTFSGSPGDVLHPSSPTSSLYDFGTTTDFSIAFRIRRITTGTTQYVITKGGRISKTLFGFRIGINSVDKFFFMAGATSFADTVALTDTSNFHTVIVVVDRSTDVQGFIDGTKRQWGSGAPSGSCTNGGVPFVVGARYTVSAYANYLDAELGHIAVWNFAIPDEWCYAMSHDASPPTDNLQDMSPVFFREEQPGGAGATQINYWPLDYEASNQISQAVQDGDQGTVCNASGGFYYGNSLVTDTYYSATAPVWGQTTADSEPRWTNFYGG